MSEKLGSILKNTTEKNVNSTIIDSIGLDCKNKFIDMIKNNIISIIISKKYLGEDAIMFLYISYFNDFSKTLLK